MSSSPFVFVTVTWAADLAHFAMLRQSLQLSPLSHIPHHVVIQHEDLHLFRRFAQPGVHMYSSADILSPQMERKRRDAQGWQKRLGRRGAKLCGSVARCLPFPNWVRYTGWHTQQLSKLAFARAADVETVVMLDSDVIVTPHAREEDFVEPGRILCYEHWRDKSHLRGKVRNWQETAHALLQSSAEDGSRYDAYYDTPFVMHAPSVRLLCEWLERQYGKPWWQVLVDLPPRRWSEFGIYKQFLREVVKDVQWREADIFGYVFDASSEQALLAEFDQLLDHKHSHFITVHSQNSGRKLWRVEDYQQSLMARLKSSDGH